MFDAIRTYRKNEQVAHDIGVKLKLEVQLPSCLEVTQPCWADEAPFERLCANQGLDSLNFSGAPDKYLGHPDMLDLRFDMSTRD